MLTFLSIIFSEQSGIYSLFMAMHYDGETLLKPTTKVCKMHENYSIYSNKFI